MKVELKEVDGLTRELFIEIGADQVGDLPPGRTIVVGRGGHVTVSADERGPDACAACGRSASELTQDPDIFDTWFSSGLWPFSTLGWPDDTPVLRRYYSTTVMETAYDIIFFRNVAIYFAPEVTRAVSEAAAMGDRSENAEYIYGKRQLRQIDARMRFLARGLNDLVVVDRAPQDTSRIFFGAWVELEDEEGTVSSYRIVGADEFDPGKGFISIDSPMAKALLHKTEGDEVLVSRPTGTDAFVVTSVCYQSS